jgi:hypothetical protein
VTADPPAAAPAPEWFSRRTRLLLLLTLFAGYAAFILVPIAARLLSGHAFGGDVAEYLLTARQDASGGSGSFHYLFPVLPALYVPYALTNPGYVPSYAFADVVSGLLGILLFGASGVLGYAIGRTAAAAAAAAVCVGTFFLILSEIGWGAQAQSLAFGLGLAAVAILLLDRVPRWLPSAPWSAGLLLGAAVLTESYSASYFVVFAYAWIVLSQGRRLLSRQAIRTYWPLVALPIAAILGVSALGGSAAANVATDPILPHALTVYAWSTALSNIDFGNVVNAYACVLLAGVFVVFAVLATLWTRRAGMIVSASVVGFLVETFLLTPGVYWDRAPYFIVFPMAAAAAVMIPGLPRAIRRSSVRDLPSAPGSSRRRRRKAIDLACAIAVAGVLLTQSAISLELYPQILRFYDVEPSQISELTWMRGETGGAVMVSPEGLTFPLAYATGRPLFPWTQPIWFDTPSERSAAITADMLVSGRQWIDAGSLKVADTGGPTNSTSPGVFVYRYPYFVKVFDLTEGEGAVPETPAHNAPPFRIPNATPGASDPTPAFTDTDSLSTYSVTKATTVGPNGTVWVNLTFRSTSPTMEPVYVGLQAPQADLTGFELGPRGGSLSESHDQPGSTLIKFLSRVGLTVPSNQTLGAPIESAASGFPTIYWPISPGVGFTGGELNVSFSIGVAGLSPSAPALLTESSVMRENGIEWAILDTSAEAGLLPRFNLDPTFQLYWSSPTYDVYRVV